jgi:hypothetical protein
MMYKSTGLTGEASQRTRALLPSHSPSSICSMWRTFNICKIRWFFELKCYSIWTLLGSPNESNRRHRTVVNSVDILSYYIKYYFNLICYKYNNDFRYFFPLNLFYFWSVPFVNHPTNGNGKRGEFCFYLLILRRKKTGATEDRTLRILLFSPPSSPSECFWLRCCCCFCHGKKQKYVYLSSVNGLLPVGEFRFPDVMTFLNTHTSTMERHPAGVVEAAKMHTKYQHRQTRKICNFTS